MKSADLIDAGNWIRPQETMPPKDTPLILLVKVAEMGGYNRDEKIRVHRICRGTWGGAVWHIAWGFGKRETVPEFTRIGRPDAAVVGWKFEKEEKNERTY